VWACLGLAYARLMSANGALLGLWVDFGAFQGVQNS